MASLEKMEISRVQYGLIWTHSCMHTWDDIRVLISRWGVSHQLTVRWLGSSIWFYRFSKNSLWFFSVRWNDDVLVHVISNSMCDWESCGSHKGNVWSMFFSRFAVIPTTKILRALVDISATVCLSLSSSSTSTETIRGQNWRGDYDGWETGRYRLWMCEVEGKGQWRLCVSCGSNDPNIYLRNN
jgi:hypothetical protein